MIVGAVLIWMPCLLRFEYGHVFPSHLAMCFPSKQRKKQYFTASNGQDRETLVTRLNMQPKLSFFNNSKESEGIYLRISAGL